MKRSSRVVLCITVFILSTMVVSANSSWHWVTVSPYKVFPFAVILTLLIEIVGIVILNKWHNRKLGKVTLVVLLANILSFLAPYLIRAYRFIPTSGGFYLKGAFNKGPFYMVMLGYLILTILFEVPVVYAVLRENVKSKKRLVTMIVGLNFITTIVVAVLERTLCQGIW